MASIKYPSTVETIRSAKMASSDLNNVKNHLSLLFDRPIEPVFMPKGPNNEIFDVPSNFLSNRFQNIITQLTTRFGDENTNRISVRNISLPDISLPSQLGRQEPFSLFIPRHAEMASRLVDIFLGARDVEDLQSNAAFCRDKVNPYMFNYAFSVAMLHRGDTRDVVIPSIIECFPAKYIDPSALARARAESAIVPDGSRVPIEISRNYTGTDLDPEHRVAYFREDLGINLHHWHWHLVYPFTSNNRAIVEKDRRGELFYYMHQQILARYNAERLSNQLGPVVSLNGFRTPIPEGYFPKLDSIVAGRSWPPRFVNTPLNDVNRETDRLTLQIANIEQNLAAIQNAIAEGFVVNTTGTRIQLDELNGIDILGNLMEAAQILSPNPGLYGSLHNNGHLLISYAHDPDGRFAERFSVMGDSATAMRDPVFYRLHAFIDDIFQEHKSRLPRYSENQLDFPQVRITGLQVQLQGGQENNMQTFWQQSDIDMSRGLDFAPRVPVFVRFTHLQHLPFTYRIQVTNSSQNQVFGYVRIFMAPRLDERGRQMSFNDQRKMMIELDKFRVGLRQGLNVIMRRSDESSVTIPYERTFRNLNANRPAAGTNAEQQFNFCGCGWPQHMLIPKGTTQGMDMDLFVMISNYADDRVNQDLNGICDDADSYCGILNRRYPDRRSMGYPFDRVGRNGINRLTDFLTPNMAVQRIRLTHRDETQVRGSNLNIPALAPTNTRATTNNNSASNVDSNPTWN